MNKELSNGIAGIFVGGCGWIAFDYVEVVKMGILEGTLSWAFGFVCGVIVLGLLFMGGVLLGSAMIGSTVKFFEKKSASKNNKTSGSKK